MIELITSDEVFTRTLDSELGRAQRFTFCSPAVDSGGGWWPLWAVLERHIEKLERAYVAFEVLQTEPYALSRLHRVEALRLMPAADGSFRVNLWYCEGEAGVTILVGSGQLTPPGLAAPAAAICKWQGQSSDDFAVQARGLLQDIAEQCNVPTTEDLARYASAHHASFAPREALLAAGAAYMQPVALGRHLPPLDIVTSGKEVAAAQRRLRVAFEAVAKHVRGQRIGFPGGTMMEDVFWIPALGTWAVFRKLDNRYWNGFGVERPGPERSIPLSVEVNLPVSGVNRRVAGALGRDPTTGKTYLLHRGRIGGGTKGIGSDLFWQRFRGGVQLRDESGGEPVRVAVVAELGAPTAVRDIAAFVHQVAIIKQAAR